MSGIGPLPLSLVQDLNYLPMDLDGETLTADQRYSVRALVSAAYARGWQDGGVAFQVWASADHQRDRERERADKATTVAQG